MPREKTLRADRTPERARDSQPPRRVTFGDVIADKLQGSTVSTFDVRRGLRFAMDKSLPSEDRVKIIEALAIPGNDVLPLEWSKARLGNLANKDADPEVRNAASRTLFFRSRR